MQVIQEITKYETKLSRLQDRIESLYRHLDSHSSSKKIKSRLEEKLERQRKILQEQYKNDNDQIEEKRTLYLAENVPQEEIEKAIDSK